MMSEEAAEKSPNDALAEEVVANLVASGLIAKGKRLEVLTRVTAGTATSEDWKLWIDVSQPKSKPKGEKDGADHETGA